MWWANTHNVHVRVAEGVQAAIHTGTGVHAPRVRSYARSWPRVVMRVCGRSRLVVRGDWRHDGTLRALAAGGALRLCARICVLQLVDTGRQSVTAEGAFGWWLMGFPPTISMPRSDLQTPSPSDRKVSAHAHYYFTIAKQCHLICRCHRRQTHNRNTHITKRWYRISEHYDATQADVNAVKDRIALTD
jgi:hypothetical protein